MEGVGEGELAKRGKQGREEGRGGGVFSRSSTLSGM